MVQQMENLIIMQMALVLILFGTQAPVDQPKVRPLLAHVEATEN